MISDEGLKTITRSDYHNKFKNINWVCDINKEFPIKLNTFGSYGSENPITITDSFLFKYKKFPKEICMQIR